MNCRSKGIAPALFLAGIMLMGIGFLPAGADPALELGDDVNIWDDAAIFFDVAAKYFEKSPAQIRNLHLQATDSDDLAVALFIAHDSGMSPDFILTLHREGADWWDIGLGFGVDAEAWFAAFEDRSECPYAGGSMASGMEDEEAPRRAYVSDSDCRDLVAVRILTEHCGVDLASALEWRATEDTLMKLVGSEYRRRYRESIPPEDETGI